MIQCEILGLLPASKGWPALLLCFKYLWSWWGNFWQVSGSQTFSGRWAYTWALWTTWLLLQLHQISALYFQFMCRAWNVSYPGFMGTTLAHQAVGSQVPSAPPVPTDRPWKVFRAGTWVVLKLLKCKWSKCFMPAAAVLTAVWNWSLL